MRMYRRMLILAALSFLALFGVGTVSALSTEQRKVLDSGVPYFNVEDENYVCTASGPLIVTYPSSISASDLEKRIYDYILKQEPGSPLLTEAANFIIFGEQFNVNPALVLGMVHKETSLGTTGTALPPRHNLTGIRPGGTFATYPNYAEGLKATFDQLRDDNYLDPPANFTTVEEIVNRWAPASDGNQPDSYSQFVKEVIQQITGGVGGASNSCASGGSGIVNSDGYAWPVGPQKKSENGTVPGLSQVPCLNTTCHHDNTPAFDLGRLPGSDEIAGTPLFAIGDGHVENVRAYNGIEGCYQLQLNSSKDGSWYWYGHIQNVSVADGDTVSAGQQIAEIGLRKCTGNGSSPHLHIDRGCIINGEYQKGGRDDCRDPDFIPFMNSLYESLPE